VPAPSGVAAVAFYVVGLVFADLLASPGFPAYDASLERMSVPMPVPTDPTRRRFAGGS
jgi:hypothetical protein